MNKKTIDSAFAQTSLVIAFGLAALSIMAIGILEIIGVSKNYAVYLTFVITILLCLISVVSGATSRLKYFIFARRRLNTTALALALSGAAFFPPLILAFAHLAFIQPSAFIVLAGAMMAGFTLGATLFAQQLRNTQMPSITHFFKIRFASPLVAKLASIILAFANLIFVGISALAAIAILAWFFGLSSVLATLTVLALAMLVAISGGMASSIRLMSLAGLLFLIAINLPLIAESVRYNGFPLGQLTFGDSAINSVSGLENVLLENSQPLLDVSKQNELLFFVSAPANLFFTAVLVMIGAALIPIKMQFFATLAPNASIDRSIYKAVLFLAFGLLSMIALMAFTKMSIYFHFFDDSIALNQKRYTLPVLYEWNNRQTELVALCGKVARSAGELFKICGESNYYLTIADAQFNGKFLLPAAALLSNLPFVFTPLMIMALVLLLTGFAASSALSGATNLVGGFFTHQKRSLGQQLYAIRFSSILLIALAYFLISQLAVHPFELMLLAFSLLSATIFPVALAAFYLRSASFHGTVLTFFVGLCLTLCYWWLAKFGWDLAPGTGDEMKITLPFTQISLAPEFGAVFALPIAFLLILAGSFFVRKSAFLPGVDIADTLFENEIDPEQLDKFHQEPEDSHGQNTRKKPGIA